MRKKIKRNIQKENTVLFVAPVCVILLGILCVIAPHVIPAADYDSLQTKEVVIAAFEHHHAGWRTPAYDYILTTDGDRYHITGDYQREDLEELLTKGKTATIKWRKNKPFWTLFAEEIYVDGQRVVTYNNESVEWKDSLLVGACLIVPGVGGIFLMAAIIKMDETDPRSRSAKSQRKRKRK